MSRPTAADEFARIQASAENYRVSQTPDEAAVRLDSWWIEQYVKGPVILELGPADGVATALLLKRAVSLDVVEGSSKYCAMLRERVNDPRVHITNSLYEDYQPSRVYDDIVLARSLEVVSDPIATLARIRGWLGEVGRFHIVVTNAASLHRRIGHALGLLPRLDAIDQANAAAGNRRIYTKEMLLEQIRAARLRLEVFKGYFLKPFDYSTMSHAGADLARELIPALFEVGKSVPDELCGFFYALCVSPE
jgi:hypothetical protein